VARHTGLADARMEGSICIRAHHRLPLRVAAHIWSFWIAGWWLGLRFCAHGHSATLRQAAARPRIVGFLMYTY
jgi:hypothetical protein